MATSMLVTGCAADVPKALPVCERTFDFRGGAALLGEDRRLWGAASKAAEGMEAVTMAELTRRAGWVEGGWDRVVHVPADTTAAQLNTASGITDFCWVQLPARWEISVEETIPDGYLLFVLGSTPVQAGFLDDISKSIELGNRPLEVVYPDSILIPKPHSGGPRLSTVK
ncbi:hypothetical protein GFY24_13345 [Nocardia sp. SYP-A9097]|uniref:hypothetical protein n=1 Tax=Nocardia sp. SYP-A9097 TaxID=2663237 RepID=UPI00129A9C85|nr:hypothetical protein [Nocardia sp. SYP-A9097]MRH88417.1 hypothetical protein [Nocardia sp. SYP-A9097]